ncbi:histidine-containing phosphotransfer protein 1-like [Pyrus x bretschneideri]|uniref:histidine-containing phosphotransfer protein 1-like n=1 Tax=Pyrus x bretschneideri TaxID=225117 RepID=UPI00202F43F2|nr:histidine-containing phosphotransfer protein 1-like [Pyrus x bretschneideri]
MYGTRLEQQLYDFTRSLQEQGILDDRFDQLKELDNETPGLAVEVIAIFIRDADYGIEGLERKLFRSKTVLNYPKVTDLTHKLKGISASVGGCRVAAACSELRESSLAYNKEKCFADFDVVKREYIYLREKLHQILEMERTIIAPYDTKKRRK